MRVIANSHTARLAIGWLTMFLVGTELFVVSPLLPLIVVDFQSSPALAGLSVAIFALAYMISAPLFGRLADRVGRRQVLICCLYAFGAANLLTAAATSLPCLLAARLFAGAVAAGVSPSVYALVAGIAPRDRRASWLAVVVSGLLVSLSLGAPIGGLVGASMGWPSVFVMLAAASLMLAWLNAQIWPTDHQGGIIATPIDDITIMALAPRLVPMVAWSTALYGVYTYLGVGLTASGFSAEQIAEVIVFYGLGSIGGVLIGGRAADFLGAQLASRLSLAGFGAGFLLLRFALDEGVMIDFAFALLAAVAQTFFPAQQSGLANDFPDRRATVLAWNNSALFLGISLGSLIGGQATSIGGFTANLTISTVIALCGWALHRMAASAPTRLSPQPSVKPQGGIVS
jgi:DHA1 family purine base/nucleoside efflux pump-like MFS transporter